MSRTATRVLARLVLALALAACGDRPPDADPPSAPAPARPTPPPATAGPIATPVDSATTPPAVACFRGGSTPDEVRAVMGPPDSILFGWWVYGRSQIFFGYGVVQNYENAGNLILC